MTRVIFAILLFAAANTPFPTFAENSDYCIGDDIRVGECPLKRQAKPEKPENMTEAEIAKLPSDQRRTKYIEGFTCNLFIHGQSGFVRYLPGGRGEAGHQESTVYFSWKVKNDEFCTKWPNRDEKCSALAKRDLANEREWFNKALSKNCL